MSHRIFICFCKGFFRDDNRDALYELLDIDRRATAADIKRAYRSKSLLMHPDKINQRGQEVTDEDRANFQKMKNAYDVLSDPKKRELYDQLGETGMLMMEDPFAAKDNMMKNFLRMGTRDRLRLVLFVVLFVGAILLWPILFCVKVDGETSASWVALWTPLWVYDALGLWYFMYLVSLGNIEPPEGMEDDWKDPFPFPMRVLALFKWVLLILFQVFVTMRLDGNIDWSYAIVGSPVLVWIGLQMLAHIYEASRPIPADRMEESILHEEEGWEAGQGEATRQRALMNRIEALRALGQYFLFMIQMVFIMMKLDDQVGWSWWIVFQPLWVLMLGQLVGYCLDCLLARKLIAVAEGLEEEDLSDEEKVRVTSGYQKFGNVTFSCCCWGCTLVSMVLAVNAIAGADYSAFVIFIPQFMTAGLLLCCMTCLICCIRGISGEDLDDLERSSEIEQFEAIYRPGPYNTFDSRPPVNVQREMII